MLNEHMTLLTDISRKFGGMAALPQFADQGWLQPSTGTRDAEKRRTTLGFGNQFEVLGFWMLLLLLEINLWSPAL
jgi:hypothetical protein